MEARTFQRQSANAAILASACIALASLVTSCGGGGATAKVPGSTTASVISLSVTSLTFGNQAVGTASSPQSVTLTNTGNSALSITSLVVKGTHASEFAQGATTCGSSLAAGGNCQIVVLFTPSATGTRTAAVSITDNTSGSPHSVSLSGVGTHDVILAWTASTTPDVAGYNIYRGTMSGGPYPTKLNSVPVGGATYADATVQAGHTYYYVATAVASDGATESADSSQAPATVPSP
jgi:trimeric autotransporter adhesin